MAKKIVEVEFRGNTTSYEKAVKTIKRENAAAQKSLNALIGVAKKVFAGIATFVSGSILAYEAKDRAVRKVELSLKNLGRQSSHTSESLQRMAKQLSDSTIHSQSTILEMQAHLLAVGKITDENLLPSMNALLDAVAGLNEDDAMTWTRQFALAFSEFEKGVEAGMTFLESEGLSTFGFALKDAELQMMETMLRANELGEAQAYFMQRVQEQFRGHAESQAETTMGLITGIKNRLVSTLAEVGKEFTKELQPLLMWLRDIAGRVRDWTKENAALIVRLTKTTAVFTAMVTGGLVLAKVFVALRTGVKLLALALKGGAVAAKAFWFALGGWILMLGKLALAIGGFKAIDWIMEDTRRLGVMWNEWLPAAIERGKYWILEKISVMAKLVAEILDKIPFVDFSEEIAAAGDNIEQFSRRGADAASRMGQAWASAKRNLSEAVPDLGTGAEDLEVIPGGLTGNHAEVATKDSTGTTAKGASGEHPGMRQNRQADAVLKERARLTRERWKEIVKAQRDGYDEMIKLSEHKSKKLARIGAVAAIADAVIKGHKAVSDIYSGALAFFSTPPTTPLAPGIATAMAAAAAINTAARISQIKKSAGMAKGGMIEGPITEGDSRLRMLAPGELVIPQKSYKDWERNVRAEERARMARDGMDDEKKTEVKVDIELTRELCDVARATQNRRRQLGT